MDLLKQIKLVAKKALSFSPIAFTQNERYDRLTKKLIQKVCSGNSVCIDIGAHEGKILEWMIVQAPLSKHYAFEPIPELFRLLEDKFSNNVHLFPIALSDKTGSTNFNFVQSNPALSGLKKRRYTKQELDSNIVVETACLDHLIPVTEKITLIKMDVEGAELSVINGGLNTIKSSSPIILFECGKIGGEAYEFNSNGAFQLFDRELNYQLFLIQDWLMGKAPLSFQRFHEYFENGTEFFFLAAPKKLTGGLPSNFTRDQPSN